MRSLRMATWTSGEPVSDSWVLYVTISSVLRSLDNATVSSTHAPEPLRRQHRGERNDSVGNALPPFGMGGPGRDVERVVEREISASDSAKRHQVRSRPKLLAEGQRERANVESGRAVDAQRYETVGDVQ